jgi:putative methionine-R-sulfoxide reductase with GAF domain
MIVVAPARRFRMIGMTRHKELLGDIEGLARSANNLEVLMQGIVDRVHTSMLRYNGVSFRLVDQAEPDILVLGPYSGSFSPQPRLPFGQGLGGAAAAEGKTIVVNDVVNDARYVKGSSMVKSEIVVPIFARGKLVAELDIQSYFTDTFKDPVDREFVESCATVVAKYAEWQQEKA